MKGKEILGFLKEVAAEWSDDHASRLGAALAYYAIFSIAPLLVIVVAGVSLLWGSQDVDVQQNLLSRIEDQIGPDAAAFITSLLEQAGARVAGGIWATALGAAALLLGAVGLFIQLQGALNTIWEVRPKPGRGIRGLLVPRLLSFGLVLLIGLLLLASLVISTALTALSGRVSQDLPGADFLWRLLNFAVSFGVITLLFAMIYRFLPDAQIAWRDVWTGAAFTALLFTAGKFGLSLYFAYGSPASAFGAAGSLVVLLVWIYYSAQIFFFGAEFTQVYARRYGTRIRPAPYAVRVVETTEVVEAGAEAAEPDPSRPAGNGAGGKDGVTGETSAQNA